ncbi:MAG: Copper amine oxidase [Hydrocarboniphaga sp.]|uniref:copper amine oxidase n=1 Tax=Hydrocarboniphaga sp. TaxID=2033016 RepID=UPI0026398B2D|nr:hypothetical protein [Hydrocarboniphaga sp.]MDB5972280.1 Copper amine oxidase [Hydrocarboniphaga sp.]
MAKILRRFAFSALLLPWMHTAQAANPSPACSVDYQVNVKLANGSSWSMCWEVRWREGIVFHDVTYTAPGASPLLILAQMNPAQIHVPYDDNGARYHDETDYGLGATKDMATLAADDCPNGKLLSSNGKAVLCQQTRATGYDVKYYTQAIQGQALYLFSVSHVGEYNYIFEYGFHGDGSLEFAAGASGHLQRFTPIPGRGEKYGWPLGQMKYGISHVHNFYWRLDFDLGGADNDAFEELQFPPEDSSQETRVLQAQEFGTETARTVKPDDFRSWRVKDKAITNSDGHAISYHLEADPAHLFHGPEYEPFTQSEVYATTYKPCENFASHNPTINGCADNVSAFVNGESLSRADLVVWYGQAFHHLPRDEDEPMMDTHWSRYFVRPQDANAENPLGDSAGHDQGH